MTQNPDPFAVEPGAVGEMVMWAEQFRPISRAERNDMECAYIAHQELLRERLAPILEMRVKSAEMGVACPELDELGKREYEAAVREFEGLSGHTMKLRAEEYRRRVGLLLPR